MRHGLTFYRRPQRAFDFLQEVDDLFKSISPTTGDWSESERAFNPAVDVEETEKAYLFHFDVPGMTEKDLQINLTGRHLSVSGERKKETEIKAEKSYCTERYFGRFERNFTLPEEVNLDQVEAKFKDGVLMITVPKIEAVKPKSIAIKAH